MFGLSKIQLGLLVAAVLAVVGLGAMYRHDLRAYGAAVLSARANAEAVKKMSADAEGAARKSREYQDAMRKLEERKNERIVEIIRIRDTSVCDGPSLRCELHGVCPGAAPGAGARPPAAGRPGRALPR